MTDNLAPEQRSYGMSRIRSRRNTSTELRLIKLRRGAGIGGWRRKSKLCGRPEFVFLGYRIAVCAYGCYWRGCRKCALGAQTKTEYWIPKIAGNMKRDRADTQKLRAEGWTAVWTWEHDIKQSPMKCLADNGCVPPSGCLNGPGEWLRLAEKDQKCCARRSFSCLMASGANRIDWLFFPGIWRTRDPYVSICK